MLGGAIFWGNFFLGGELFFEARLRGGEEIFDGTLGERYFYLRATVIKTNVTKSLHNVEGQAFLVIIDWGQNWLVITWG